MLSVSTSFQSVLGVHVGVICVSSASTSLQVEENSFLVTTYQSVHCNNVVLMLNVKWLYHRAEGFSVICYIKIKH